MRRRLISKGIHYEGGVVISTDKSEIKGWRKAAEIFKNGSRTVEDVKKELRKIRKQNDKK